MGTSAPNDSSAPLSDEDSEEDEDSAGDGTSAPLSVQDGANADEKKPLTIAEKKAARKRSQASKLDAPPVPTRDADGKLIESNAPADKNVETQEFADVMAEVKARKAANTSAKLSGLNAPKKKAPSKAAAKKAALKKAAPKKEDKPIKQNPDDIEMDIDIPEDEDSSDGGGGQGSLF